MFFHKFLKFIKTPRIMRACVEIIKKTTCYIYFLSKYKK